MMVYLIPNPSNMMWIRENYSPYLNKHTIGIAIAIEINLFTCLINMKHQNLNKLLMSNPYFSQKNEKKNSSQINETSHGCFCQVDSIN
uniref:Uncharacterized protein n=1 Tax=Populus trichocarpa TaxID=3694 RepID=A0A2K2BT80_POPTR